MDNLIFSLNATAPVFIMMLLGLAFKKIGWIDDSFADKMNKFVYMVPLPVLVFEDLATVDFSQVWDLKFLLYCFGATLISIIIAVAASFFCRDRSMQGEFIQASYRSSSALLGIAFIQNIYGESGLAPLMILGSVPLYNVMAVVILSVFGPEKHRMGKGLIRKTLAGIITNPTVLGIAAGFLWSALRLPMPPILEKTVANVSAVATPLGLMAMGATFDIRKAFARVRPAIGVTLLKLVGFAALFLPVAVMLGFRREELVASLVMLGSATTVSCFVMAKNMGHEGILTSSVVMLTTMVSAFTLTGWLYILRSLALI
ncbi:AEC family transporter [Clostridium sp. Marseille-P3244]|uniref:AEC family transporter n=1 Tax=Clostridium sp. Marseille-P3244 TaxID=1871020 RepID=UPI000930748D|nr:AEC family transporter [Clostridium sp. Marseille-P3244]